LPVVRKEGGRHAGGLEYTSAKPIWIRNHDPPARLLLGLVQRHHFADSQTADEGQVAEVENDVLGRVPTTLLIAF